MTEQFNLCFQTLKIKAPVTAQVIPGQGVTHLIFAGDDHQPWHSYSAPVEEMPAILRDLLQQAVAIVAGHNPLSEIDEWHAEAEPAPEVEHFTRQTSYTPKPPSPSGRGAGGEGKIILADLHGLDDETALALLIERFRNSNAKIYNALLTDYFKVTGRHYKGTSASDLEIDALPPSPSDAQAERTGVRSSPPRPLGEGPGVRVPSHLDLQTIRPHLHTLIQNGQFCKGIQSRIAEILSITNSGPTNRERILAVMRVLEAYRARQKLSSSSSSSTDEAPPKPISDDLRVA